MTYPRSGRHSNQLFCRQSLQPPLCVGGSACQQLGVRSGQIGVQAPLEREQSPSFADPIGISRTTGSFSSSSLGYGGSRINRERCGGSGPKPSFSGILREAVRGPQIFGGVETSARSICSEPVPSAVSFQDGNGTVSEGCDQARGLGRVVRPEGRVFPYSDSCIRSEVPPVFLAGSSLPVHSIALRPRSCPMVVYQSHSRIMSGSQGSGPSSQGLPGRLVASGHFGGPLSTTLAGDVGEMSKPRVYPELGEIGSNSESGVRLPGYEIQHPRLDSVSIPSAHFSSGGHSEPPLISTNSTSQVGGLSSGFNGINGHTDPSGSSAQTKCAEAIHGAGGLSGLVPNDASRSPLSLSSVSVAGPVLDVAGCSHCSPSSTGVSVHRCVTEGVGRSHGQSDCFRPLGFGDVSTPYKPFGAGGSFSGSETLRASPARQTCVVKHRQHDSGVLPKQTGGGTFLLSFEESGSSSSVVSRERYIPDSQVYTGKAQHIGRRVEQVAHGPSDRVDHCSQSSRASVETLVQARCGSVRNTVQQTSQSVCITGSGPTSVGDRCVVTTLGSASGVRLPSPSNSTKSPQEGKGGSGNSDSNRPSMGEPVLVPRAAKPHTRKTSSAKSRPKVSSSASDRSSTQKPGGSQPSRVASVRESLSARGASADVINLVEQAHRPGTKKLYDARWSAWSKWCSKQKINPVKPSRIQFANYLAYLANDKKLSASTVKGHRASISTTIKQLGGHGFSEDYLLKDVVKGVSLQEARTPRHFPAWDLKLVLETLRSEPFEPVKFCPLDKLTFKCVFLISLASGRRCSEVHALQYQSLAWETDGSVSLRFLPGFLAKNQPPDQPSPPIIIKALAPTLCPDDIDNFLCPVRCLKSYLKRTIHLRSQLKRRLFVSPLESKKSDITVSSISRWIKNVIKEAYNRPEVNSQPDNVRAHEVRAWATSLAWANNTSLKDIMEAAYWFGRPTFFQFYLRDVSHKKLDGSRGISLVAAQQILKK